jgi:hypothetical protein
MLFRALGIKIGWELLLRRLKNPAWLALMINVPLFQ